MMIDLLNRALEEIAAAEPKPENKRKLKLVDPLARFPLGKIEAQDRAEDSRTGQVMNRKYWEAF